MVPFPEFDRFDGLGLAELVRKKQIMPVELIEAAIARIEAGNPSINAVIYKMYDEALMAVRGGVPDGPFTGVPFLLKDLFPAMVKGVPTSCGTRVLRDVPMPHDSEMVRRWRKAGLVFLGKTNTPEFGLLPYTEPEAFGATNNPWDFARTAGGSSGGSAAAVAARFVPLAGAADGGGSIRIPSSCCGVFGLKPTRGRTPIGPDVGELWRGFVQEHAITRSVRDSAAALDAVAGADIGALYWAPPIVRPYVEEVTVDPGRLRIAFTADVFLGHRVHEDCRKALESTVRLLEQLGHEVVEAVPPIDRERFNMAFFTMVAAETRHAVEMVGDFVGRRVPLSDFETTTAMTALFGRAFSAGDYANALNFLTSAARGIGPFFEDYDVFLTPALSGPPILAGSLGLSGLEKIAARVACRFHMSWLLSALHLAVPLADKIFDFIPYTPLFNVTGHPAMSVPLYWNDEGLPIGSHFVGRFGDEATLFRLAGQLERTLPWFDRAPPGFSSGTNSWPHLPVPEPMSRLAWP